MDTCSNYYAVHCGGRKYMDVPRYVVLRTRLWNGVTEKNVGFPQTNAEIWSRSYVHSPHELRISMLKQERKKAKCQELPGQGRPQGGQSPTRLTLFAFSFSNFLFFIVLGLPV